MSARTTFTRVASKVARAAGAVPVWSEAAIDRERTQRGLLHASVNRSLGDGDFRRSGFGVFSQTEEDGHLQFLVDRVQPREVFVEIGVDDYRECNTRFLAEGLHWTGVAIDGGHAHVDFLTDARQAWRHGVVPVSSFVTTANADELVAQATPDGELGLLSIDIDGNDYWVWQAITTRRPEILVIEFNATFGPTATLSIPYAADFDRSAAHYSNLYAGASLAGLEHLGREKGYALIGINAASNNAFFVRDDRRGQIPVVTAGAVWRVAPFRESRDEEGNLTLLASLNERIEVIGHMPVVDVTTGATITVRDAVGAP